METAIKIPIPDTNDPDDGFPTVGDDPSVVVVPEKLDICLAGLAGPDEEVIDPIHITYIAFVAPTQLRGSAPRILAQCKFPRSTKVRQWGSRPLHIGSSEARANARQLAASLASALCLLWLQKWVRIPMVRNMIIELRQMVSTFYKTMRAAGITSPTSRSIAQSKVFGLTMAECAQLAASALEALKLDKKQDLDFAQFQVL